MARDRKRRQFLLDKWQAYAGRLVAHGGLEPAPGHTASVLDLTLDVLVKSNLTYRDSLCTRQSRRRASHSLRHSTTPNVKKNCDLTRYSHGRRDNAHAPHTAARLAARLRCTAVDRAERATLGTVEKLWKPLPRVEEVRSGMAPPRWPAFGVVLRVLGAGRVATQEAPAAAHRAAASAASCAAACAA